MLTRSARLCLALALLAGSALALPAAASAHEARPDVRPGVYDAIWHTDRGKLIIESVGRDGTVIGQVRLDAASRFPNARFDVTGNISGRDGLTLNRVNDGWGQVARTGPARMVGGAMVWCGTVSGDGLDQPQTFELRVPVRR